jgi:hypothetical protein
VLDVVAAQTKHLQVLEVQMLFSVMVIDSMMDI